MRSYEELLAASGYARRPDDFNRLLAILGNELRLITPTEPESKADGGTMKEEKGGRPALQGPPPPVLFQSSPARYYHLTHDYLVPSLREWLTRKERATIGGRAAHPSGRTHGRMDGPPIAPLLADFLGVGRDLAVHAAIAKVVCRAAARGSGHSVPRDPRGLYDAGRRAGLPPGR